MIIAVGLASLVYQAGVILVWGFLLMPGWGQVTAVVLAGLSVISAAKTRWEWETGNLPEVEYTGRFEDAVLRIRAQKNRRHN